MNETKHEKNPEELSVAALKAMIAETRASIAELRASQAETDREIKETARQMKATHRKLEKFGLVQGEVAEDLFRRNVKRLLEKESIRVDKIITNMKEDETREYDIVAVNGDEVVVFEIKNKLRSQDLRRFTETQLPQFKEGFPRYRDYTVYGGIGALVVNGRVEEEARKRGLFVLTQGADGNAEIHRPQKLRGY